LFFADVGESLQSNLQNLVKQIVDVILTPRKIFEEELNTSTLKQSLIRKESEFSNSPADCLASHANVSRTFSFFMLTYINFDLLFDMREQRKD